MTDTASRARKGRRPGGADGSPRPSPPVIGLLVLLAGAGVGLRFVTGSPLWLDEALSVNLAALPVADLTGALRHDGHPALYYLLLGGWIELSGDGDWAVRALSGLAAVATIPMVVLAAGRRFGPRAAFHAGILTATSPFLIRYGTEARMYSLVAMLVALGWWAIERAREESSLPRLALVTATTAALLHTHYWTIWLVTVVMVLAFAEWHRSRTAESARLTLAIGVGGLALVPWLPILYDQARHTGTPWAGRARPAELAVETIEALGGGMRFEPVFLGFLLLGLVVLGALALGSDSRSLTIGYRPPPDSRAPSIVVAATLLVGGGVALVSGGTFEARYAAVVIPVMLALAGRALSLLPVGMAMTALIVLGGAGIAVAVDDARRDRTQGQEAAGLIDELAAPGDVVVFCPDQLGPATLRYLEHGGTRAPYPSGPEPTIYPPGREAEFVDWYDYRDRIESVDPVAFASEIDELAGDDSIWLVLMTSYRGFEGRCESVAAELGSRRGRQPVLGPRDLFEPAIVERFGPRS